MDPSEHPDVYRQMPEVLGSEREEAATRDLGRWRDRTLTGVLLAAAVVGIGLAMIAYDRVQDYQFEHNHGIASMQVNVAAAAGPFILMMFVGRLVGRALVRKRTPAKIEELARAYEISGDSLAKTAKMVDTL